MLARFLRFLPIVNKSQLLNQKKMKLLIFSTFLIMMISPNYEIDFGQKTGGQDWQIINDGVMGGLSKGQVEISEETLIFKGTVSLENNGGFTSLRGPYQNYDLSNFETLTIKYKSTGQDIAFRMKLHERWYMPYFKANLRSTDNEWQTVSIPLKDFEQYRVGDATGQKMSPKDLANVIGLGFITNSKKASAFQFEVDFIRFD